MNNFVYKYEGKLYLNITNRCSNACTFCIRNNREGLEGNSLWLDTEPSFLDVIKALTEYDLDLYEDVTFCGFGEPVYNLEVLIDVAKYFKHKGKIVKLNTNGQGNKIHNRNIVPDLAGVIDVISISLNASNSKKYQDICNSEYGTDAYQAVLNFTKECVKYLPKVILSKVDEGDNEENKACENMCQSLGASFRLRKMV